MNSLLRLPRVQRLITPRFCVLGVNCSNEASIKTRIDDLVKKGNKIVVFMKGTPDMPQCGFSNAVMQILKFHGVENFDAHNVLGSEDLRQGIKDYSNWPTIPQIFMNGEFVGGCDIMMDMHKNGELIEQLKELGIRSALLDNPEKKPE